MAPAPDCRPIERLSAINTLNSAQRQPSLMLMRRTCGEARERATLNVRVHSWAEQNDTPLSPAVLEKVPAEHMVQLATLVAPVVACKSLQTVRTIPCLDSVMIQDAEQRGSDGHDTTQ